MHIHSPIIFKVVKVLHCLPCTNYLMYEFQLEFLQSELELKTVAKQYGVDYCQIFKIFSHFFAIFCLCIIQQIFFSFHLHQVYPKHSSSFSYKQQHFIFHTHISSEQAYLKFMIATTMLTGINRFRNEHKWFLVKIQLKCYKRTGSSARTSVCNGHSSA